MKTGRVHRSAPGLAVACTAALICVTAAANPTGPTVVNGAVNFNTTGNTLTVTNSPNSIINWQGFSISTSELTHFLQQSAASAVLNRVVGVNPSSILGALQSNGRVFLVNPNGIVFGAGSQVDVAGLVATTLNITDANFLVGTHQYTAGASAGSLVIDGAIVAQNGVYVIAPNITISGSVTSTQGTVVLAAGQTVNITESAIGNASSVVTTGNGMETISLTGGSGGSIISGENLFIQVPPGGNVTTDFGDPDVGVNCCGSSGVITNASLNSQVSLSLGNSLVVSGGNLNVSGGSTANFSATGGAITATGGAITITGGATTTTGGAVTITGGATTTTGGAVTLSAAGASAIRGASPERGQAGGAITVSGLGTGSGGQPPFIFGDTSNMKVVETRDATGNITGWSLASQ